MLRLQTLDIHHTRTNEVTGVHALAAKGCSPRCQEQAANSDALTNRCTRSSVMCNTSRRLAKLASAIATDGC